MIVTDVRPERILLDTCAIIYLFNGEAMEPEALEMIDAATVLVSPISAWEIGVLARRRKSDLSFLPDVDAWFRQVREAPSVVSAQFNFEIALASSFLPEPLHKDPADRLLIATARALELPIVTRDKLILAYATSDHVDAIAC